MAPPNRTQPSDYHYHAYDFVGSTQPWGLSAIQPNRNGYQFYSMLQDLNGLRQFGNNQQNVPNVALYFPGATLQDQITAAPWNLYTLALSFGNRNNGQVPTVVFTGGIHAREWIAHEFVYLLAEYLIMHYAPGPVYANTYQQTISQLIDNQHIVIVPMLNPAGNYVTVFETFQDARMWRKNRRLLPNSVVGWQNALNANGVLGPMHAPLQNFAPGQTTIQYDTPRYQSPGTVDTITVQLNPAAQGVDGNRNFDTPAWGHETRANNEGQPTSQTYFGTNRLSENETNNLVTLLTALNLNVVDAAIDYHAYGQLILYPTEGNVGAQNISMGQALQRLIVDTLSWTFTYDYKLGTDLELVKYKAVSSVSDYMSSRRNSRSFTIELDPELGSSDGFQLPQSKIMGVFEKNIRAALALIASAGDTNLQVTKGGKLDRHQPLTQSIAQFLTWKVFGRGNQLPV